MEKNFSKRLKIKEMRLEEKFTFYLLLDTKMWGDANKKKFFEIKKCLKEEKVGFDLWLEN